MRHTQTEIMSYFPFKLEAHRKRGILSEQELSAPFSSLWDLIVFAVIIQEAWGRSEPEKVPNESGSSLISNHGGRYRYTEQ